MIGGRRVLAVVAARGGSKGLPGKNLADIEGQPMVAWSVRAGLSANTVDRVIISTDDSMIAAAAREAGCEVPFMRPATLATDEALIQDALIHALDQLEDVFDYLVLLQATSPLRSSADIDACIALCHESGSNSAISVAATAKPPYWMFQLDDDFRMRRVLEPPGPSDRRQDLPPTYAANGAVYVVRVPWFRKVRKFVDEETRAYVMPSERSVDVDHHIDLLLARVLAAHAREGASG